MHRVRGVTTGQDVVLSTILHGGGLTVSHGETRELNLWRGNYMSRYFSQSGNHGYKNIAPFPRRLCLSHPSGCPSVVVAHTDIEDTPPHQLQATPVNQRSLSILPMPTHGKYRKRRSCYINGQHTEVGLVKVTDPLTLLLMSFLLVLSPARFE